MVLIQPFATKNVPHKITDKNIFNAPAASRKKGGALPAFNA